MSQTLATQTSPTGSTLDRRATTSTRRNLGPLTTATFTAPDDCEYIFPSGTTGSRGVTCDGNTAVDETTCWPPRSADAYIAVPPFDGWGFYSPGIVCPLGYTTACNATAGGQTGWDVQFPMTTGETAAGCCPTGFTCGSVDAGQTCLSTASPSESVITAACVSSDIVSLGYITLPVTSLVSRSSDSRLIDTVTQETLIISAPMIQINWQSTDLPTVTSSSTVSTSSAAATGGSSSSSKVSGGAIAGAVIGGIIALALIIGTIFFFIRRRARAAKEKKGINGPPAGGIQPDPIKGPAELPVHTRPLELSAFQTPMDASSHHSPVNASSYHSPVEMPGE